MAAPPAVTSNAPPNDDLANGMRAGSLAVACLTDVPDAPVLGRNAAGFLAALRAPQPGQLYEHHLERLDWIDEMVANHGLRRALNAADLEAAHAAGQPAIVADIEGLDFLEMKLERLEEAHQRGIRHVQLVHYTPNDIGDFQTGGVTQPASPRSAPRRSGPVTGSASFATSPMRPRPPSKERSRSQPSRCCCRTRQFSVRRQWARRR